MRFTDRITLAAVVVATGWLSVGCSATERPSDPPAQSVPSAAVVIPVGGIALAAYGLTNGPVRQLSVPANAVLTTVVDQTNNVSAVMTSPPAGDVFTYLLRSLPDAGFTLDQQDQATTTLTFHGYGWTGRFTGDERASAVLLRPKS